MSQRRVRVEESGKGFVIRIVDRENESEIEKEFLKVFAAVNPAATLPLAERTGSRYSALFNEGPMLFKEQAIDPPPERPRAS